MKTLSVTIILCTTAIILAILAPSSISGTNETDRIATLEEQVGELRASAQEADHFMNCYTRATPVSAYKQGGKLWLAPTRSVSHKRLYVALINANCMPHVSPAMLGWKY